MKKIVSIALVSLITLGALVAQTVTFPAPERIATKAYVDSVVAAKLGGVVVDPGLSDCKEGPQIFSISDISTTGVQIQFHGKEVYKLRWTIDGLKSDTLSPRISVFRIAANLEEGYTYTLKLEGVSCKGSDLKTFTVPVKSGGDIKPPVVSDWKYTVAPKMYFSLQNDGGVYSDVTYGDYIENGQTFRNENNRKYLVFYWINEVPYLDNDKPKAFEKVSIVSGLTLNIRKVYVDVAWQNTFSGVLGNGWETWYQNPSADTDRIWKTVSLSVNTAGGRSLVAGDVKLKQNPGWLDASTLIPQFIFNSTNVLPKKPVGIQCFPSFETNEITASALYNAGITHVWEQTGLNGKSGLKRAAMWGSQDLGDMFPGLAMWGGQLTEEQAKQWASSKYLESGMIATDEFAEGTYPQFDQSREWFYQDIARRVKEQGLRDIKLLGEYGYGSTRLGIPSPPLGDYAKSLWGEDMVHKLEVKPGSSDTQFIGFIQNYSKYRGSCFGRYYTISEGVYNWITDIAYNTIQYNPVPEQPKMLFTWAGMQSNVTKIDTPQADAGTIRPDGSTYTNFPDTPAEIMKMMGFFGMLFYDSVYLWDAYGTPSATNPNNFINVAVSQDAFFLGTRWATELELEGDVLVADFSTDGKRFSATTVERKVPRFGQPRFNNTYFNEIKEAGKGFALVIPSDTPRFVYINPGLSPVSVERVVVHYNGKDYDLGEIPGMTLAVSE